jgi:hypothetical protein
VVLGFVVVVAQLAAAEPAPSTLQQIAATRRVRVTTTEGSFVLMQAWADAEGLHFRKVRGYPMPRLSSMAARRPPPPEPPTSPLAWAAIERVEEPVRLHGKSPAGAIVGLLGGALLGSVMAYAVALGGDNSSAAYVVWGATALGGMMVGAKTGEKEGWHQIHPAPAPP